MSALPGALVLAACLVAGAADLAAGSRAQDPRSVELLDLDCANTLERRQVTLFANGTVRLRKGPPEEERVFLIELAPSERDAYLRRLAAEDLGETDRHSPGVEGDWVEHCALELAPPRRPARRFTFDSYASLSLSLSRVVAIAHEIGERAEAEDSGGRHLPADYQPTTGDVLERLDGELFRVRGITTDRLGVELTGIEQPITLFIRLEDLRSEFVAVIEQRRRR